MTVLWCVSNEMTVTHCQHENFTKTWADDDNNGTVELHFNLFQCPGSFQIRHSRRLSKGGLKDVALGTTTIEGITGLRGSDLGPPVATTSVNKIIYWGTWQNLTKWQKVPLGPSLIHYKRGVHTNMWQHVARGCKKQQETRRKRDDCANKMRLLVMQMVRKVLTLNVYNKLLFREQTRPEQCHHNVLAMRNMNSVGHNGYITAWWSFWKRHYSS